MIWQSHAAAMASHDEGGPVTSIPRCGYRRRPKANGLLRLQRADVEGRPGDEKKRDKINHIGLRRGGPPPPHPPDGFSPTPLRFHPRFFLESALIGRRKRGRRIRRPTPPRLPGRPEP